MACGVLLVLLTAGSLIACSAYYLPGTYPQEFTKGQTLRGAIDRTGSDAMFIWRTAEDAAVVRP